MITFATLLIGTRLVVNAADAVPNLNVEPTCRAGIDLAGSAGRTVENCINSEHAARRSPSEGVVLPNRRKSRQSRKM